MCLIMDYFLEISHIDDIVEGVSNTILKNSVNKNLSKIYNIGNIKPVKLLISF